MEIESVISKVLNGASAEQGLNVEIDKVDKTSRTS